MWTCPHCGRTFANRNQTHRCAALGDLDAHFAGCDPAVRTTRRHALDGHLVLAERIDSPRFTRIHTFSPHNVLHAFRLTGPEQVDDEFAGWLRRAYAVGEQRHRGPG